MQVVEHIQFILQDLDVLLPEMVLVIGAIFIIIFELFNKGNNTTKTTLSLFVLVAVTATLFINARTGSFFNGIFLVTEMTLLIKYFLLGIATIVLLYPFQEELTSKGEYHFLLFTILLGSFLLIQAHHFLTFYLALELISISSYVLITFSFNSKGFEAGVKYLLFGAVASGLMLYGISLIYGLTGTLDILGFSMIMLNTDWLQLAFWLFFVGVLFKLSLVPMHIWSPDVYQAGPTSVVAFISVVPQVAVVFFVAMFLVESQIPLHLPEFQTVVACLSMLSMLVGNLSALAQPTAKRMMAYSSIAHAGVFAIGITIGEPSYHALYFYLFVYGVLNIAAFYLIALFLKSDYSSISDLAGIGRKHPFIGILTLVVMVGLVGLPPTGGFTSKLLIFSSLWDAYQSLQNQMLLYLFIVGLLNTAIALFYYLKIPFYLFVKTADTNINLSISIKDYIILTSLILVILGTFFKADFLLSMIL